jgi:cupin 2 domain-containing protein
VTRPHNLLADVPEQNAAEQLDELLARRGIRIERIVSTGQASPQGFWYDQPQAEWVLVLRGQARLRFEDEPESTLLEAGSYVDIAPHRRHRVEWTDPDQPTIWLAIHYTQP